MSNFINTIYNVLMLSGPVAFLALAYLVWRSRTKLVYLKVWSAFCVLAALTWLCILGVTRMETAPGVSLVITRAAFSCGAVACFTFLAFSLTFLESRRLIRWLLPVSALVTLVFISLFLFSTLVLKGVSRFEYGTYVPEAGLLMPVYLLSVIAHMLVPTGLFVGRFLKSTGVNRLQIGYILLAVVIIGVAATGSLIPTFSSNSFFSLVPMVLSVAAPGIIAYAIIRHQLWDIRTVIHRTVLWFVVSTALILPLYWLLKVASEQIRVTGSNAAFFFALVLFGIFALYFKLIQPWIDQRFGRRVHDPIKVLDKFNHEVLNLRGVKEYADLVVQTVRRTLYSRPARVRVVDQSGRGLRDVDSSADLSGEYQAVSTSERQVYDWLVRFNSVVDIYSLDTYAISEEERKALEEMCRARDVVVMVPFIHEGDLLGVLELGNKENLKAYTREDFRLLEQVRSPATVAMSNAMLYDRLHELMLSLESRVQQRTQELRVANEQMQELDRQKSKFFANITHELKTPLTLILAPLEDLMLEQAEGKILGDLKVIHRNALRLLRQINSLLDLAKIDAGTMRLKVGEFRLDNQIDAAVRNFGAVARRKEVRLSLKNLPKEQVVIGDAEKLDLVWANLLANAVKFTDPGGSIEVRLSPEKDCYLVAVEDTGIGIPKEHLTRIFDRFAQVDSSITRRHEGAGIGLSLVQEILKLHKGTISVRSELGKGSCFEVRLPRTAPEFPSNVLDRRALDIQTGHARRAEDRDPVSWVDIAMDGEAWVAVKQAQPEAGLPAPALSARHAVMIVDDNADLRNYLGQKLAQLFKVVLCEDGQKALEAIRADRPDLVVMDVMMPELSGFDLCRILRENPKTADIPIILVTARRGVDRALEGFQVGANDYLTKPFNVQELIARIQIQLKLVELSRRLAQREKGAVLNLVAAGLAHEVRNPANAIINAVPPLKELIEVTPGNQEAVQELLGAVQDSANRIEQLCSDLLGMARPDQEEVSEWHLEETLESTLRILGYKYGHKVEVTKSLRHRGKVLGHTPRLNQVLLNLLDNGLRAAGPQGHLWVTTEESNGRFKLRIRDDGPGIPAEIRERIFDPLFSTHFNSGSSGLGLYIVKRIVEEHQGTIQVTSAGGEGAEFTIEIPLCGDL
ncbi:MAG: response regulator [Bradymonadales bacterium]|nr:response regulator [Bradymonadales bacterium]